MAIYKSDIFALA